MNVADFAEIDEQSGRVAGLAGVGGEAEIVVGGAGKEGSRNGVAGDVGAGSEFAVPVAHAAVVLARINDLQGGAGTGVGPGRGAVVTDPVHDEILGGSGTGLDDRQGLAAGLEVAVEHIKHRDGGAVSQGEGGAIFDENEVGAGGDEAAGGKCVIDPVDPPVGKIKG